MAGAGDKGSLQEQLVEERQERFQAVNQLWAQIDVLRQDVRTLREAAGLKATPRPGGSREGTLLSDDLGDLPDIARAGPPDPTPRADAVEALLRSIHNWQQSCNRRLQELQAYVEHALQQRPADVAQNPAEVPATLGLAPSSASSSGREAASSGDRFTSPLVLDRLASLEEDVSKRVQAVREELLNAVEECRADARQHTMQAVKLALSSRPLDAVDPPRAEEVPAAGLQEPPVCSPGAPFRMMPAKLRQASPPKAISTEADQHLMALELSQAAPMSLGSPLPSGGNQATHLVIPWEAQDVAPTCSTKLLRCM